MAASLERGYDCSGTIGFALFDGRFLKNPLDSGSFMSWARPGKGRLITVYTNPGHAYVVIGGLRLDTIGGDRLAPEERSRCREARGDGWFREPRVAGAFRNEQGARAVTLIAHAADWLTTTAFMLPEVLFLIWLGLTTVRDRRTAAADEREEHERESPDRAGRINRHGRRVRDVSPG